MALNDYPNTIEAAQCAAEAAGELLRAAREDDAVSPEAAIKLADALRLTLALGDDRANRQLVGAIEKWLDENA